MTNLDSLKHIVKNLEPEESINQILKTSNVPGET